MRSSAAQDRTPASRLLGGRSGCAARNRAVVAARKYPQRSPTSPNGAPSRSSSSVTSYGAPSRPTTGTGRTVSTDPSEHRSSATLGILPTPGPPTQDQTGPPAARDQ